MEIHCDEEGLSLLVDRLTKLGSRKAPDHDHLMTPGWAGWELTEEEIDPDTELVNHLVIYFVP